MKYKNCCEKLEGLKKDFNKKIFEQIPEPFEKGGFLTGRPFITETANNRRFRAVGRRVYQRPIEETFHQFILVRLSECLSPEWIEEEKNKESPHIIVQWYAETEHIIETEIVREGPLNSIQMTGNIRALLALAYDFYTLEHCLAPVLPKLLNRLKNTIQFQGARYEIATAGTACRSGFQIQWLSEDGTLHGEFTGTHKITGYKAVFEAKSHYREGVLGKDGNFNAETARTKITDHIRDGLKQTKGANLPLILFDDLNLPLNDGSPTNENDWFSQIDQNLEKYGFMDKEEYLDCVGLIITNFSWHFHYKVPPTDNEIRVYFRSKGEKDILPNTMVNFLIPANKQYGHVPALLHEFIKRD